MGEVYLITSSILVALQLSVDRVVDCCLTSPVLYTTGRSLFADTPRIISRGTFLHPPQLGARAGFLVWQTNLKGRRELGQECTLYADFLHLAFPDICKKLAEHKYYGNWRRLINGT